MVNGSDPDLLMIVDGTKVPFQQSAYNRRNCGFRPLYRVDNRYAKTIKNPSMEGF